MLLSREGRRSCAAEGAALHDYEIITDIPALVSIQYAWMVSGFTHEKMTFLESRFLEKGRRSGSCLDVQSSMAHYRARAAVEMRQCLVVSSRSRNREALFVSIHHAGGR